MTHSRHTASHQPSGVTPTPLSPCAELGCGTPAPGRARLTEGRAGARWVSSDHPHGGSAVGIVRVRYDTRTLGGGKFRTQAFWDGGY